MSWSVWRGRASWWSFIKEVRRKDPGIGGNKLWQMYRNRFGRAHSVGYNRFYDIIEKYGLKVRSVKRRVRTTDSSHGYPVYPDLTRSLIPDRPCQLVVSDITYIPYWADPLTGEYQFCYLSLVTDYYTKESSVTVSLPRWRPSIPCVPWRWPSSTMRDKS